MFSEGFQNNLLGANVLRRLPKLPIWNQCFPKVSRTTHWEPMFSEGFQNNQWGQVFSEGFQNNPLGTNVFRRLPKQSIGDQCFQKVSRTTHWEPTFSQGPKTTRWEQMFSAGFQNNPLGTNVFRRLPKQSFGNQCFQKASKRLSSNRDGPTPHRGFLVFLGF